MGAIDVRLEVSEGLVELVALGHGWAARGYSAADIDPTARGVGWLIADGGIPLRMRAAFLTDEQVCELAAVAARRRAPREAP